MGLPLIKSPLIEMRLACKACRQETGEIITLVKDAPGWLKCPVCKHEIEEPQEVEFLPRQIAPMHGLERKEMRAGDAYEPPDQPEFPQCNESEAMEAEP